MNDYFYSLILGAVQGLAEFLPISSTAHLILLEHWFELSPAVFGLNFNVFVHAGTLLALVVYFRTDVVSLLLEWLKSIKTRSISNQTQQWAWYILIGTVPAGLIGYFLADTIEARYYNPQIIAILLIGFSIWFALSEYYARTIKQPKLLQQGWIAIIIALAQDIALFPGVSRSGITYTTALWFGIKREQAARFTFLLSIPIILGATLYSATKLQSLGSIPWGIYLTGVLAASITGLFAIKIFMKVITTKGLWPFIVYRVLLGGLILLLM